VSAAFELAEQVAAGLAPPPRRIVVPIGSTCTTAGLLAGLVLAHAIGLWRWPLPIIHGVRVTPWPVTSHARIAAFAHRTLRHAAALAQVRVAIGLVEIFERLVVDRRELGRGYGRSTERGDAAMRVLPGPRLDGVYSAKAAAALLRLHRAGEGPLVFWATKSSVVLPPPTLEQVRAAPHLLRRWLSHHA
jgi:D-cysteine desulfhydrase